MAAAAHTPCPVRPAAERPFSPASRLTRQNEFDRVRSTGETAVGRYCVVQAAPPVDGQRRVAIVISRYYSRRAVDRNRARRLFREGYRELFDHLRSDAWVVMRPRQAMKGRKSQHVAAEMRRLFGRLGLLTDAIDD